MTEKSSSIDGIDDFDGAADAASEQLSLFGDEEYGADENAATQDGDGSAATGAQDCTLCPNPVRPSDEGIYREVTSWVGGKKRDSAVLRTYTGRLAHGSCIQLLRAGDDPTQTGIIESLDAPDKVSVVGEGQLVTDDSPDYKLGYEHGLAGERRYVRQYRNNEQYKAGWRAGDTERFVAKTTTKDDEPGS